MCSPLAVLSPTPFLCLQSPPSGLCQDGVKTLSSSPTLTSVMAHQGLSYKYEKLPGRSVVLTPAVGLGPLSSPDPGVDGARAEAPENLWLI